MGTYLSFEKPIESIEQYIESARARGDLDAVEILEKDLQKEIKKIYGNLSDYQKLHCKTSRQTLCS